MMVVTELKMGFPKLKRVMLAYCNYKHFNLDNTKFRSDIQGFTSKKSEIWDALKKLFFAFLSNFLLLKESKSVLMRLPPWKKPTQSYREEIQVKE